MDARPGRRQSLADLSRNGATAWPTTSTTWATPTSSCCRSAEHPFDGSWGYQTSATSPRPAASARRRTSCTWSTRCTSAASASSSTGCRPTSRATSTAWAISTAPISTSTPTRACGDHQDWGTFIFNYGRNEVSNFLISNALFWLDKYHIDGLRVDAVASMLYLDYSRKEGEWIPNHYGGRENLEAIAFLRRLNERVYGDYPRRRDHRRGIDGLAAGVAADLPRRPRLRLQVGHGLDARHAGLPEPRPRPSQVPPQRLTFRMLYAFTENYVLPLSHDEVVHGKRSLLSKMPGDDWQKFANLRLLFGYMYAQPGKKLLFMGGEFGQWHEWNHDTSLDWHLLE